MIAKDVFVVNHVLRVTETRNALFRFVITKNVNPNVKILVNLRVKKNVEPSALTLKIVLKDVTIRVLAAEEEIKKLVAQKPVLKR